MLCYHIIVADIISVTNSRSSYLYFMSNKKSTSSSLSRWLLKKGYVATSQDGDRMSLILMILGIILCGIIIYLNQTSGQSTIDPKYYYDPTDID